MQKRWMLIIYGPTGVGKTDCALELAPLIHGEIINADVGQFYTPLTIGTAKPDWKKSSIQHHLFDVIDNPRDYTVAEYRTQVVAIMNSIWQRNHIPIIVGGSGFYISSLFFPPEPLPSSLKHERTIHDKKVLWQQLYAIDPQRAAEIHPHDTYRIQRALELWHKTGKKPSDYKPSYNPPACAYILWLDRHRDDAQQRIKARTVQMLDHGWIEEVQALKKTAWEPFLLNKKIIGYDDILHYLDQDQSVKNKQALIDAIVRKTRLYAKRQRTFWKMLEKKLDLYHHSSTHDMIIKTIDLTIMPCTIYGNHLIKTLMKKEGNHE